MPIFYHCYHHQIAFVGNWQACPTAAQLAEYTHVIISFAVSYTWSPNKNICSQTCEISTPPICNNAPNPTLVNELRAAGKKVLLSFGGAGMGGSWAGDVNNCWDYCFGRETQVVDRLTQIVKELNVDGVDIDYEYFYADNQNGSGFAKGAQAINFLSKITSGLKSKLPVGSTVSHAPMDADLSKGSKYLTMLESVKSSVDYILPQYYNGITRPVTDGFFKANSGRVVTADHYKYLVDYLFGGDATRVVMGFCISDCSGTSSNALATQARSVMNEINTAYNCHGGAFFWVAAHDVNGKWSSVVNEALKPKRGCSGSGGSSPPPNPPSDPDAPSSPPPTTDCCPSGFTGFHPTQNCGSYFYCQNGVITGNQTSCSNGLLFDVNNQVCNWSNLVTCSPASCTSPGSDSTSATPRFGCSLLKKLMPRRQFTRC